MTKIKHPATRAERIEIAQKKERRATQRLESRRKRTLEGVEDEAKT
jgi:hypothetical protein